MGWASWPSPWPQSLVGPCQKGSDQDQLLGCCLGQGHLSPVSWSGDGQAFVIWLGAISLSAPGLKIKRFISGWLVPAMLSGIASLRSPVSQPFPSVTVPLATVTLIQGHIWGDRSPAQRGGDAPTGLDPSSYRHRTHFKPRFHPSFYFAPAQLLSQLLRGAKAGVSLSPWDGIIGFCRFAQSLVFLKLPPGWEGTGPAGDVRPDPHVQNPFPSQPILFGVSDILKASSSRVG